jgi:DNA polymerase III subunit epsilon
LSREIVLDTETTGLEPAEGHRIVEIGCVEIVNRFPTGQSFHVYLNPERDMPPDAFRVHGLSDAFLADKPLFRDLAEAFLEFIGDSPLVIHNAAFDLKFLNHELKRAGKTLLSQDRVIDTVILARRRHPGQRNDLDSLCDRYGVDRSKRTKHGALLDSEILADIYAELMGGKQANLLLSGEAVADLAAAREARSAARRDRKPSPSRLTPEEDRLHRAFIAELGPKAAWLALLPPQER